MAEYIVREALKNNLHFTKEGIFYHNGKAYMDLNIVDKIVLETPIADVVEVKYGYWEIVKGSNGKEKMVCTNCRHQQDLHSTFTYCPNCGALIDGRVIHNG